MVAQNKRGASLELAEEQKLYAKRRVCLLTRKSTSDPAGNHKHQPKSAAHSANRSNIGNRTKLYNLRVLFLPGQGTSTLLKICLTKKENSYLIIRELDCHLII